jgi:hypothetical protein
VLLAFPPFYPSFLSNPHRFCFSGDVEGVKITAQPTLKTEKRTRQKTKGGEKTNRKKGAKNRKQKKTTKPPAKTKLACCASVKTQKGAKTSRQRRPKNRVNELPCRLRRG